MSLLHFLLLFSLHLLCYTHNIVSYLAVVNFVPPSTTTSLGGILARGHERVTVLLDHLEIYLANCNKVTVIALHRSVWLSCPLVSPISWVCCFFLHLGFLAELSCLLVSSLISSVDHFHSPGSFALPLFLLLLFLLSPSPGPHFFFSCFLFFPFFCLLSLSWLFSFFILS